MVVANNLGYESRGHITVSNDIVTQYLTLTVGYNGTEDLQIFAKYSSVALNTVYYDSITFKSWKDKE